ncbi:hypothetical protein CTI14_67885, partial [Methylobacterium radiotolerans]
MAADRRPFMAQMSSYEVPTQIRDLAETRRRGRSLDAGACAAHKRGRTRMAADRRPFMAQMSSYEVPTQIRDLAETRRR